MTDIDPTLARWITAPGEDPQNPLLRASFELSAPPTSARLLVTGLGVFRAFVNGEPYRSTRLDPGLTDARRRVLVCEADVAALLHRGTNVLGIALGRGFHAMTTPNVWRWEQAPWRGPVRAWAHLRIELADGSSHAVTTGSGWRTIPGPISHDSMYEGEVFEGGGVGGGGVGGGGAAGGADPTAWLRGDFDDSSWDEVLVDRPGSGARRGPAAPEPRMQLQVQEPVVVREELTPRVLPREDGPMVLDMGRVIAGWCRYELTGPGPLEFSAVHGEKLREDGRVDADDEHIHAPRFQEDLVRLESAAPRFEPQFSYKGFRYVELEARRGSLDQLEVTGLLAHADLPVASTLTSSDPYLERFDQAMRASLANNMHHVPTDTPMHEKNGWTGDALTGLAAMTASFDLRGMLRKWAADQADGQRPDGSLSVIAPNPDWGYQELSPAPEWTTLLPVLLDEVASEYGEADAVREHGAAATAYLTYELGRRDEDGLISGVLGDYLTPGSPGPAPEDKRLTATLAVAQGLRALAHAIVLLDEADDLPSPGRLREDAGTLEAAVNTVFLDTDRGVYRDPGSTVYRQTSNLLPLARGIVPSGQVDAVLAHLVEDIEARGDHHDCGHIGVRYLLPVLSAHGHGALALRVLANPTAPGWRAWLEAGNSTFMEMWENPRSCSHYFMGTPSTWIHEHVAGLRRGRDGWREFLVAPDPEVPVGRIELTRTTVHGEIDVEVDRDSSTLTVTVPEGTHARVVVPGIEQLLGPGAHAVTW
ncbi:MAG: glycoside hydrolase family 78 protein [Brachybacterium sp.]|uniref:family 78 glycoside hydrolase catalytic domain n=1 Tax=Brachybacterium sp. TaxID=1891286 RepID=UPI002649452A|nr:family 78 glycoside hydrolase catalytic domain [Brachybacterium sp.]MDN5685225.1 glycoside hydrolase family 78 protein [Brachybacterium sp.]